MLFNMLLTIPSCRNVQHALKIILVSSLFTSCTTARLTVPEAFQKQAAHYSIKGLNGWMVNQKLSFGPYHTSTIKRGWDFINSVQYSKFHLSPEETLLKVFDINTDNYAHNQQNKFQYTLEEGDQLAEIYATEKFSEKQLVYKTNNPYIGSTVNTIRYEYAFTAAIVPLTTKEKDPWSLVLINRYNSAKDTARKLFDKPYVEEEGYATNGKENLAIRPLRVESVSSKSGKAIKMLGGQRLSGYELQWNGRAVAIIDLLDTSIWGHNDLEPSEKLIVSSIASAMVLKRMQDVAKEN